jgi:hypothetical protein
MRKGIILEINDLYLTLLTPEGEFLRTRKLQQEYQVGEEIHFFPEMAEIKRRKFNLSILNSFRVRTISLAAAFMLIMTVFIPVYQGGKVYAYMSIDVNPSVELAVDDELKVLRLKGYNPEGDQLIEEISGWKRKDAADVAEMILDKIEEKGYFEVNNDVVIATVHNGEVKESADQKLEKKISEIKKATQKENIELKVMEATSEDREKAKKQGLTTGLYKEKQNEKAKPASKQENNKPTVKPEAIQQKPALPVKPQQQPGKTGAPGQVKKQDQDNTKQKRVQPSTPSNDKKNNSEDKGKKESNNNLNSKVASKGKKQDSSHMNSSGKGKTEKKSSNHGKKSNNKKRDHKGQQKDNRGQSGKDKKGKS